MNKVTEIMFSAIRTQVCGAQRIPYGDISDEDMKALYSLSKSQDMAHIVATELQAQGLLKDGHEISEKLRRHQMIALFRYERINYELTEICGVLEQSEIPHMPLKGSVMRKYYSEAWMRTSADIDILVKKEDTDRAVTALVEGLEYTAERTTPHDVQLFSPSGVHLELHFETVEESRAVNSNTVLSRIWESAAPAEGTRFCYELSDGMFYFYHLAHMAKHFEVSGCGLRFFLDMWLLNHNAQVCETERKALLEEGGLTEFARAAEKLSEIWFSLDEYDGMSRVMERYVLGSGVYGSHQNTMTLKVKKQGRVSYIFERIFPRLKDMKRKFPILERHVYLLPLFYVVRCFRIVFRGRLSRSANELKYAATVDESYTDGVDKMFERFGLIKGYGFSD